MTGSLDTARRIIADARAQGARTLSEYDSKQVLAAHGVPGLRSVSGQGSSVTSAHHTTSTTSLAYAIR